MEGAEAAAAVAVAVRAPLWLCLRLRVCLGESRLGFRKVFDERSKKSFQWLGLTVHKTRG